MGWSDESSQWRFSVRKVFLKFSQILLENTCVGVSFSKVSGLKVCNFIKKRLQHSCFSVNIVIF